MPTGSLLVHPMAEGHSQNAPAFCLAPLPGALAQVASPGDRVKRGECQGAQVRHQQGQRHHFKKGKLDEVTCPRPYSEWQTGVPTQSPNSPRACLCGSPQRPGSQSETPQPPGRCSRTNRHCGAKLSQQHPGQTPRNWWELDLENPVFSADAKSSGLSRKSS